MSGRNESGLFSQRYTDDAFIVAIEKALENPTATAAEIADILGCNPRYAVNRLTELAESGKIESVMKGRAWGFRLKK